MLGQLRFFVLQSHNMTGSPVRPSVRVGNMMDLSTVFLKREDEYGPTISRATFLCWEGSRLDDIPMDGVSWLHHPVSPRQVEGIQAKSRRGVVCFMDCRPCLEGVSQAIR